MDFKIPKTEKWVKQVIAGDVPTINNFLLKSSDTQSVRGVSLLGIMGDKVVVVYERNANVEVNL